MFGIAGLRVFVSCWAPRPGWWLLLVRDPSAPPSGRPGEPGPVGASPPRRRGGGTRTAPVARGWRSGVRPLTASLMLGTVLVLIILWHGGIAIAKGPGTGNVTAGPADTAPERTPRRAHPATQR